MNAWIIYAVAFSQIVVLYGLFGPLCIRMFYGVIIHRNPQWVNDNPAFQRRYPAPKYSIWLFYLAGAAWIAFFVWVFFTTKVGFWLLGSLTAPVFPFTIIYLLYIGVEYFRVLKRIPLPTKRTVPLERRSLQDIVNPWWVYLSYLFLAIIAGVYLFEYYDGKVDTNIFARRMIGLAVVVLLATGSLIYSIRRKKQPIDELVGAKYRKFELSFTILVLYLGVGAGALRLLQDVFAVRPFSDDRVFVALSVFLQIVALYCVLGLPFLPKRDSIDKTANA